jgi:hypothetical protein
MNRRERLMSTLAGKAVDRPAVCFYEINGLDEPGDLNDPFNIYTHPSWAPLIELAREKSDRIVMRSVPFERSVEAQVAARTQVQTWFEDGCRYERSTIRCDGRFLSATTRRDPDVNTVWQVEHLLKDAEDLRAYLDLPANPDCGAPDLRGVLEAEAALGDGGIVMIDTADALCLSAALFDMATFTVLATTETTLFQRLLDRFAAEIQPRTEAVARALPGRLWRIYGPEYASPPYLHPRLFHEYVVKSDTPMVQAIQRYGGYARIHSHGRLRLILDEIASTGCDGLDPIEPPPQGDLHLAAVRERCGQQMVLFGNLEASDLENLPADEFMGKVQRALSEGTQGGGRGFVLMPSSCPYGRILSRQALLNYQVMIDAVERG